MLPILAHGPILANDFPYVEPSTADASDATACPIREHDARHAAHLDGLGEHLFDDLSDGSVSLTCRCLDRAI
jgi:hypothetical protein